MKKSMTAMWATACLLLPATASAAGTLDRIRDSGTMVIGYREGQPPFSYLDGSRPTGYAVELCQQVAEAVRRELKLPKLDLKYLPVDSVTRFSAVIDGKADVECGSTTNNAERRKKVAFSVPYFFSGVRALVRTDSGIRNWPDLRGRTVATTRNTTTIQLLNDRNNVRALGIRLIEGDDDMDSFRLVKEHKADVFPMDDVLLFGLRANADRPSDYAVVGDPLSVEPYGIMMRKDDAAFKKVVDSELVRLIYAGDIYKIYDRWFMRPIPPKGINMNMPMGFLLRDLFRFPTDKMADQ